jgi:vacuolar iron transporter family protein
MRSTERHVGHRLGWLRAGVLGANDGIVSTASLILGVAASGAETSAILTAGAAALVAGAMSMAAGEYVSVSSQSDAEQADLRRERAELASSPELERAELAGIYVQRGLTPELANEVALQLSAHDALGAHARDELGLSPTLAANPLQAALASAAAFALGALLPLLLTWIMPPNWALPTVALGSLACLAGLGALSASVGGAPWWPATRRVVFWGVLAMAITALIGWLFGVSSV